VPLFEEANRWCVGQLPHATGFAGRPLRAAYMPYGKGTEMAIRHGARLRFAAGLRQLSQVPTNRLRGAEASVAISTWLREVPTRRHAANTRCNLAEVRGFIPARVHC